MNDRKLAETGYVIEEGALSAESVALLREEISRLVPSGHHAGGLRNAARKSAVLRSLANDGPPALLARAFLGSSARPVKVTVFDKTPAANWKVPWHQDLTIAIRERRDAEGFGPWTVKDGVPHVQPPVEILSEMLSIRVHLDDTPESNGALRVIPGSHLLGRLSGSEASSLKDTLGEAVCAVSQGGMMAMRPLLLHASSAAREGRHRRVIHTEYAAVLLPFGLEWDF